jgi:lipopolysaccharide export system protein LptA
MKFWLSGCALVRNIIMIMILISIASAIAMAKERVNKNDAGKLQITSDRVLLDQGDFSAHFKGNVMVYFKDYILKTEELIITYDAKEKKIEKITIPKTIKMVKKSSQEIVIADRAFYDKKLQQLILAGNVIVQKENHVLKTNQIIYDIKKLSKE